MQIKFTIGEYSDALHFTDEEFNALTENEIEVMKQARYDNWLSIIAAASVAVAEEEI